MPFVKNAELDSSAQVLKYLMFDRVEKFILFRITRSYTWAILILSVLGFIGAMIYLAPDIRPFIIKDTGVSVTEVKKSS